MLVGPELLEAAFYLQTLSRAQLPPEAGLCQSGYVAG